MSQDEMKDVTRTANEKRDAEELTHDHDSETLSLDDGKDANAACIVQCERRWNDLRENQNDDNQSLGVDRTAGMALGYVDACNGSEAQTRPAYVPTRRELLELAKYWLTVIMEFHTDFFLLGLTGSIESRTAAFAGCRLSDIESVLGSDAMQAVAERVEGKFRERLGDRLWDIFQNGTAAQVEEVRAESYAALRASRSE
jgi:hypothetical protein